MSYILEGVFSFSNLKCVYNNVSQQRFTTTFTTLFSPFSHLSTLTSNKLLAGVTEAGGLKQWLFEKALAAKTANLRSDKEGAGTLKHMVWDTLVFGPLKKRLGLDRVEVILTGSAPLSPRVMNFLRAVFGVPVCEGYGQTEGAAGGTLTTPDDYTLGHVGVPAPACEISLFDVPEMSYMSTDTVHAADGSACRGRGEICLRGVNVFAGYERRARACVCVCVCVCCCCDYK